MNKLNVALGLWIALCGANFSKAEEAQSKSYLENPEIVLQYDGSQKTSATLSSAPGHFRGEPSPTGSNIYYARTQIEPVTYVPFKGQRYTATIPATLDLAERGELTMHALTSLADPKQDYEIYGWIGNIQSGNVIMKHTYHDYNGGQAKWMMDLPLMRTMCGSEKFTEIDRGMMETMFRMIGDDGLYYIPAQGASWVGESDSVSPWTEPGVSQVFDVWPNGRALLCLVTWYARDPKNEALKKNIDRMIAGWSKIAYHQDGAAWIPRHFYDGKVPPFEQPSSKGTAVTSQSTILPGVARYYMLTGDPAAKALGDALVKYWLGPAHVLKENGDWDYDMGTHFHGTTFALLGLLDWAQATNDTALMQKLAHAYEFGRGGGVPLIGWFPEGYPAVHPNSEPCGIGDMTDFAARLSSLGVGDYWEDVEHYTRNLLTAAQITDSWFVEQRAHAGTSAAADPMHVKAEQTYHPGKEQGLMIRVAAGGALKLFYQDGNITDPASPAWKDITPSNAPEELLKLAASGTKIGVCNFEKGNGDFLLSYVGLHEEGNLAALLEDQFAQPAGPMKQGEWRFNESANIAPNNFVGDSNLKMPMQGTWNQYIDRSSPAMAPDKAYSLIFTFTMPELGEECLGFTNDGSMTGGPALKVFRLRNGSIYFSNDVFQPVVKEGNKSLLFSSDNVSEKMRGTFSGMTSASGQFQTVSSHCCTGNGARGLFSAWRAILNERDGELRVNLLLNRASQWADINSYLPYKGRVDVIMKKSEKLLVRIPSWVTDPNTVKCYVTRGRASWPTRFFWQKKTAERKCTMDGRYLNVGAVKAGDKVVIQFPLQDKTEEITVKWIDLEKRDPHSEKHAVRMRGFDAVDITPRRGDIMYPFFTDPGKRQGTVEWKTVERFAPANESFWGGAN